MIEHVTGIPWVSRARSYLWPYRFELLFGILFLALTLVIFRGYFASANPLGTDAMGLPFIITASEASNDFFSTWISYSGLGFPDYPLPTYQSAYMVATAVGLSPLDIAKLLLPFSFWLAGVSMFICVRRLTNNNLASVTAALVFSLNQVYLSQVIDGHYYFVLSYALFPLVFLIFYELWRGRESRWRFLVPLALVAYGTLAPPNIVLIASLFLALLALAKYVVDPFPVRRLAATFAFIALILAFLGLSVVLANNIPTYSTSYPIQEAMRWSSPTLMDGLTIKASENSFFFGNATDDWVQPAALAPLADVAALVVPILAFSSLLFRDLRRFTLPIAIVTMVFIFFAKGPFEPLSGSFIWAFNQVPLLDTIRVYSRFSLFTGFAYGLLIAYLVVGLTSERATANSIKRRSKFLVHMPAMAAVVAIAVGSCLVVQSGAVLTGAVGGFDLPEEYEQPFDWVGEQEGDFRILNLPYMADYHNGPSSYGYPNTTTIDPGIYSLLYTGKDTAYGASTSDFWFYFDYAIQEKNFGYRNTPSILGNTASVRYVVVQPHTSAEEKAAFLSLKGLVPVAVMDGGGMVLENEDWSPRATAYGNVSLATGGRDMLTKLTGMGLFDPQEEGLVFLSQLTPSEAEGLLDTVDRIYLDNGDATELLMEMSDWSDSQSLMLYTLGASHTTDDAVYWVQGKGPLKAGLTLNPTLYTTGDNSVTVDVKSDGSGPYEIYLKLMRGPDAGNLSISAPGVPVQTYDAHYPVDQMAWVRFQASDLDGPITITSSGGSSNLEQLVIATPAEVDVQKQKVLEALGDNMNKLVYVYTGSSFGDVHRVIGPEGEGIAPTEMGGTLSVTAGELFSGQQRMLLAKMNASASASVIVGDEQVAVINSADHGEVFDLGQLGGGEEIGVRTDSLYGLAIYAGEWSGGEDPIGVSYDRPNSGTYRVIAEGEGPYVLRISESYNSWWRYEGTSSSAVHVPINSIVNGYLVEGSGAAVVEYQGKSTYLILMGALATILLASTSLIVFRRFQLRKKDGNG